MIEAVEQAARKRCRPILMTSLATIVGVLPIALGLLINIAMRPGYEITAEPFRFAAG